MKAYQSLVLFLVNAFFLLLLGNVSAQERTLPTDGWQGPRPTPQTPPATPFPQPHGPSPSKQTLEIPPQPQATSPPPPQQEVTLPPVMQPPSPTPALQPPSTRPSQLLTVTVTDQDGRYITDLRPEDFVVYEADLPQPLSYFNTGQNEPMSLGLVIDSSESMLNKIGRARQALRLLADTIQPQDEVFLSAFSSSPVLLQDFTDSRALVMQATARLQPAGRTALYDALLDGLKRIGQGQRQKKALVVITDGVDTSSQASLEEVATAIRGANVLVYTIGIGNPNSRPMHQIRPAMPMGPLGMGGLGRPGSPFGMMGPMGPRSPLPPASRLLVDETVDSRTLEAISEETGAKHFLLNTADVVGNGAVLEAAADTIVSELRQQYSLGYRSALKGDVHREVRIETRRGDAIVRTQKSANGNFAER
jgi:VWFA-related protein